MSKEILIEKFLENQLSDKEKVLFDRWMAEDSSFKKEVSFQQNLKKAIQSKNQDDFKILIGKIENEIDSKEVKKNRKFPTKWLVAASFLFLFALSFLLQNKYHYDPEVLFNQNFQPYRNVIFPINRGIENNPQQDKKLIAFRAYENGNYQKAVTYFSELYENTHEPYYLFYKANALLKLNKPKEAIPLLKEHLQTNDTLKNKSNWYLALAYIKSKDTQDAKEQLRKIIASKSYNYQKAKKLLKKIP